MNAAMEAEKWGRLAAALDRAEKLEVSFRLLKAVPIGKAVKKVGKKAVKVKKAIGTGKKAGKK